MRTGGREKSLSEDGESDMLRVVTGGGLKTPKGRKPIK